MKVLMLNGSPKANGNTNAALLEVGRTLENEGISYEIFQMGGKPVRDCIGCGCKTRRQFSIVRLPEQVFRHSTDACCRLYLLEHGIRQSTR